MQRAASTYSRRHPVQRPDDAHDQDEHADLGADRLDESRPVQVDDHEQQRELRH
jgi:hypothetical protein